VGRRVTSVSRLREGGGVGDASGIMREVRWVTHTAPCERKGWGGGGDVADGDGVPGAQETKRTARAPQGGALGCGNGSKGAAASCRSNTRHGGMAVVEVVGG